jgi:thiol-disulfide isomerase/thioredoxin
LNRVIDTKSYRENVFLINFWASWCVPSRKQNPEMLKLLNKYRNAGFKFIGVSFDKDSNKWNRAINQDQLICENVIDIAAFDGLLAAKYGFTGLPSNLLVDRNRLLIGRDIPVSDLKIYLNKHL